METVQFMPVEHGVLLTQGTRALRVTGPAEWLRQAVSALRTGVDESALSGGGALTRLVGELHEQRWITDETTGYVTEPGVNATYQRQLGYLELFGPDPAQMQGALERARVAIVGLGGIGALLAQQLVAAGASQLWLIDHDQVEPHNLNRQHLYTLEDVGTSKTVAAIRRLTATVPAIRTSATAMSCFVTAPEDLDTLPEDLDLLVVAADTPATIVNICWTWAKRSGTPLTMAAVGLDTGYWGPLLDPALGHCWPCFEAARKRGLTPDERTMESATRTPTPHSFGPSNSAIAALLSHDVIRYLAAGRAPTLGARGHLRFDIGAMTFLPAPAGCDCPRSSD